MMTQLQEESKKNLVRLEEKALEVEERRKESQCMAPAY